MGDVETFGVELYFYLERQIKRIWGILDVHKIGLVSEEQYIHALKKLDGSWSRDIKELVSWEMEWRSVMKLMHERTTEQCTSPPEIESNKIDENMITFEEFYTNIMELAAKIGSNNVKRCFNRWLAIVEKRIPDSVLVSPIRTGNATPKTIRNKEREQITIPKSIASSKIISLHPVLPPGNKQKYRVRVITRKDMTAIQVFQNWQKQKSPRPTKHGLMAYDNRMEYYTYGNAQGQSRKEDTETRDWGRYASSYRTHNDTRITTPSPRTRRAKRAVSELRRSHKKCHQHKRPQTVGAVRQRSPRYFLGNPERPTTSMPDRPLSPQKLPARPKIAQPEFQIDENVVRVSRLKCKNERPLPRSPWHFATGHRRSGKIVKSTPRVRSPRQPTLRDGINDEVFIVKCLSNIRPNTCPNSTQIGKVKFRRSPGTSRARQVKGE